MKRSTILKKIIIKVDQIQKLKTEILELERANMLLSDRNQQYVEAEENVTMSYKPLVHKKVLVGRVFWKEKFIDESDPKNSVFISRSKAVKVDGEWL